MKGLHEKSHEADEMVSRRDVDKTPGKATRIDDAPSQNLLSPEERAEKVIDLKLRIVAAGARCNDAIQAVKIHTLMKKPDDIPWVFGMLLDVCVTTLTTSAIRSLSRFKAGKIGELGTAAAEAAARQDMPAFEAAEKRRALFQRVSDETIKARVGAIGGFAKSEAKSIVASTLADTREKAETISYLAQLQRSMDTAFQNLGENGTKGLSDPELMVFFDAMDASHHSSESYERAITDKVERYKKSRVDELGKAHAPNAISDPQRHYESIGDIDTDRRVVWVTYPDGSKNLWFYEKAESTTNARSRELAAGLGMDGRFRLTGIVAPEFWDEAIARSEEMTGKVETLPDSPATRAALGMPAHQSSRGTIRGATNKIFGGR